jgi:hypothetical protein
MMSRKDKLPTKKKSLNSFLWVDNIGLLVSYKKS